MSFKQYKPDQCFLYVITKYSHRKINFKQYVDTVFVLNDSIISLYFFLVVHSMRILRAHYQHEMMCFVGMGSVLLTTLFLAKSQWNSPHNGQNGGTENSQLAWGKRNVRSKPLQCYCTPGIGTDKLSAMCFQPILRLILCYIYFLSFLLYPQQQPKEHETSLREQQVPGWHQYCYSIVCNTCMSTCTSSALC